MEFIYNEKIRNIQVRYCKIRTLPVIMADKDKNASILPLSRVKTIMKSSPDVSSVSQEALYITGKATVSISLYIF